MVVEVIDGDPPDGPRYDDDYDRGLGEIDGSGE